MRIFRPCLIVLAIFLCATFVSALEHTLTERQQSRLSPEGAATYKKALHALDHVLNAEAMEHLLAIKQTDPGNVPIRLLLAEFATAEGRKNMGEEAIRFFRIAEEAYAEIMDLPVDNVDPMERDIAEKELKKTQDIILKQAERDARKIAVGKEIIKERAQELYPEKKDVPTPTPAPAAAQAPQGMPPGMMMDPSMMGMF